MATVSIVLAKVPHGTVEGIGGRPLAVPIATAQITSSASSQTVGISAPSVLRGGTHKWFVSAAGGDVWVKAAASPVASAGDGWLVQDGQPPLEIVAVGGQTLAVIDRAASPIVITTGGLTPRIVAGYTVAASAGAFADGDLMGNSETAASVVPISLDTTVKSGEITGVRCAVNAATGAAVLTNLAFDLHLFRPATDVPYAAAGWVASNAPPTFASNAAAKAYLEQVVGVFSFAGGAQAGQGGSGWIGLDSVKAAWQRGRLPPDVAAAPFNLSEYAGVTALKGLMIARAAWNNGNVAHTFTFALDVRGD